jgi:hypothetical protein
LTWCIGSASTAAHAHLAIDSFAQLGDIRRDPPRL